MKKRIERLNGLVLECQRKKDAGGSCNEELREIFLIVGDIWSSQRIEAIIHDFTFGQDAYPAVSQDIRSVAQDVRQDILIKVYEQGIWAYRPDTAAFSTYLYRLVYNSVIDALRRLSRERRVFRSPAVEDTLLTDSGDALRAREAAELIGRLPDESHREIIRRYYLEGEKLVDIAGATGMSAVLVGVYKRRALKELRRLLGEETG